MSRPQRSLSNGNRQAGQTQRDDHGCCSVGVDHGFEWVVEFNHRPLPDAGQGTSILGLDHCSGGSDTRPDRLNPMAAPLYKLR